MIRLFVSGASGNVGRLVVREAILRRDVELAGGFCLEGGQDLGVLAGTDPLGLMAVSDLRVGLAASSPDVVVDFTSAVVLRDHLELYAELGLDAVVGTTGLPEEEIRRVRDRVRDRGLRLALVSNFGLGINLVMDFLAAVGEHYPYVSVLERHPASMANAPSGTAGLLASSVPGGSSGEVASREVLPGVLGGNAFGVPVLSQRMPYPGPYSEHEVTLGRQDEILRISVTDFSSSVYLEGIFRAVRGVGALPPGTLVRRLGEFPKE